MNYPGSSRAALSGLKPASDSAIRSFAPKNNFVEFALRLTTSLLPAKATCRDYPLAKP
uniref:Uncharacterized protein n=1 Tax=Candidatus Kentrum sp. TC TaxID=2126339 RepID=A0A450Y9S8_9GAMM|nr:MAG: hypothetical protein BECKTC1821E_GA0114239_100231 [Candidatus Kentron sp. TC]VFK53168.1 MAG: hypothetical protein BECKTC1821F_GA0114240_100230 [Candidatus Kentron sp. TC]